MKIPLKLIAGLVFLFTYSSLLNAQSQLGGDIDGEASSDQCGYSVSLSADGSRMAVGAPLNDGSFYTAGHVRIYEYSSGSWSQLGSDIDGEASNDRNGNSVSLSADGSRVAIGAYLNDGAGASSGHVRIYEYSSGNWSQLGSDIDGEAIGDQSGISVSMSADGSRVAIGAYLNDGNGTNSGHTRIYQYSSGSWSQLGSDIDGETAYDYSGRCVSLSGDGDRVAIGATGNDDSGNNAGHVRVYAYNSGSWSQIGSDIDGEAADDYSGHSVALSTDGNSVAIGAYGNDGNGTNSGQVRVYQFSGDSWSQIGSDIDGETASDESAYSIALTADGSRVAIGTQNNDGNGNNAGHVRIYDFSDDRWSQLGIDIDGEAANDNSGYAVSISDDGERVAIGAIYNEGAGHARVYSLSCACAATNAIPTDTGTYSSSCSQSVGSWTHYCDADNKLLLSLKLGSSGAVIADDEVSLKIESPTAAFYAQDCGASPPCFIDLSNGAVTFKRSWDVDPTTQPSSGNVGVKYYFTKAEYDAVNTEIDNQSQNQLTGMNQMWFYKVTNNSLGQFPDITDVTPDDVAVMANGSTAGVDEWVLSTKVADSEYVAEFEVSSFSGGGGGGAGDGMVPLPIDLIYFHVYASDGKASLEWASASELNNHGYEILRSRDASDWESLGFVAGAVNSFTVTNYQFTDPQPYAGINYYRLLQSDFDGNQEYLPIRTVDMSKGENKQLSIFPNPAHSYINITNFKGEGTLYDLTGHELFAFKVEDDAVYTIDVKALEPGAYYFILIDEYGTRLVRQFMK